MLVACVTPVGELPSRRYKWWINYDGDASTISVSCNNLWKVHGPMEKTTWVEDWHSFMGISESPH